MENDDLIVCDIATGSTKDLKTKIVSYLFDQCRDLYQLKKDEARTIREMIGQLKDRYMTIKGHIQSGKTKFMICTSSLFLLLGYSVVIILRNNKADQEQIHERLVLFEKEMNQAISDSDSTRAFRVCRTSSQAVMVEQNKPRIYLTLGNGSSTMKMLKGLDDKHDSKIALFIDEVDFVDSGDGTHKSEVIPLLKQHSHCIFGVSATIMDPLGKENVFPEDVILLSVSPYYKGIPSIEVVEIDQPDVSAVYTGKTTDNLFETDEGLLDFVKMFSKQKPFTFANGVVHPHICLVNICRTKDPTVAAQTKLARKFPNLMTIVYNGDGITYAYKNETLEYKGSISSFLQMLKDTFASPPNILIFSGDLAGRGISFTSSDFKWHLTSMRLLVANQCDEPELIQRVRLCGVYHDDVKLTLYSTSAILCDIKKAYFRQEEIVCNLKKLREDDTQLCKQFIESLSITKDKFTRRSPVKDKDGTEFHFKKVDKKVGWDLDVYLSHKLPPDQAYTMYGVDAPSTKERNESGDDGVPIEDDRDAYIYVDSSCVNKQTKLTFELVTEFMEENHHSGWIDRSRIAKYLVDTQEISLSCANSRLEKVIQKGTKHNPDEGIVFKKVGPIWKVKKV